MSQLLLAHTQEIRDLRLTRPPGGEPRQPVAGRGELLRIHVARGPLEAVANLPTPDQQPGDPAENHREQADGDAGGNPGSNHHALNTSKSCGWPGGLGQQEPSELGLTA